MRILAIDTSTRLTCVALCDGARVVAEDDSQSEVRHGELLVPRIRALLQRAGWSLEDLALIGAGVGPGSFTGLRVGLATAKGLALAVGVPLRGVSSLRVLARGAAASCDAGAGRTIVTWLDAHRGEVFGAVYRVADGGGLETRMEPFHAVPEAALARVRPLARDAIVCGDGIARHRDVLGAGSLEGMLLSEHGPSGRHVAAEALARFADEGASDLARLEPSYLRDSDATLPSTPLSTD